MRMSPNWIEITRGGIVRVECCARSVAIGKIQASFGEAQAALLAGAAVREPPSPTSMEERTEWVRAVLEEAGIRVKPPP